MLRRISLVLTCGIALILMMNPTAWALDEDAEALQFLPADAPMVMAVDMDEFLAYTTEVGMEWREADRSHFADMLEMLSSVLTREAGKPDVLTFFERLSGVQAFTIDPSGGFPLLVFSTESATDSRILGNYTAAYIVEHRYNKIILEIAMALNSYYLQSMEDPETGEMTRRHTYPETFDDLVEEGLLDEWPMNPYTGERMQVLGPDEEGSLGDISYRPCHSPTGCLGGCCGVPGSHGDGSYLSYELVSYHIGGILTTGGWGKTFEPYDDLASELMVLEYGYDFNAMGLQVMERCGWTYVTKESSDYAFAYGDRFLIFGKDVCELMSAVRRFESGSGFQFDTPADFDTSGAFLRGQTDMGTFMEDMTGMCCGMGCPTTGSTGPTGSVSGTVFIDGRPQAFGNVALHDADGQCIEVERASDAGHYIFNDVRAGTYSLYYSNNIGMYYGPAFPVEVPSGDFAWVDLELSSTDRMDSQSVQELVLEAHNPMDAEMPPMFDDLMSGIGIDAIETQHTACWLRDGDIESVRRVELTGEARGSLIGSMVYAEPEELMTAEGGPFEIIGEFVWANPDEYIHAYLDYAFEFVLPMMMTDFGMEMEDPNAMLSMVGLGDIHTTDFGEQAIVLLTGSTDRGDGVYLPGLVTILETDNPDLGYMAVGFMDSVSFMVPDFPFYQADFGDEDSFTWVSDDPEIPITPTIAWGDGWLVKALWREDAILARDYLRWGMMLMPDGMDPANARVHFHRQELLRGLADVMYELPVEEAPVVGGFFELVAQLSEPDERLYAEMVTNGEYVETRCLFSIDIIENLIPVLPYVVRTALGLNPL